MMTRAEAIDRVAREDIARLSPELRAEELASAGSEEALLQLRRERCAAATSAYLIARLAKLGVVIDALGGAPAHRESCPCCGRRTLEKLNSWDICLVCWWEDEGFDNERANEMIGGSNGYMSLTQARHAYLTCGIYDPERTDLREVQDPPEMYELGRVFTLGADGRTVREPATRWSGVA
jgi:hypothetical protein